VRCALAVARAGGQATIREVADSEGIGVEYTAKLLQLLRRNGVLQSTRGAQGGYALTRPPESISLWDVLRDLEPPLWTEGFCEEHAGQRSTCAHGASCSLRVVWRWVGVAVESAMRRVTLADVLAAEPSGLVRRLDTP
jgi:Rrf2 family protein